MTASRRLSPKLLLRLIGLAALAVLVLIPGVVQAQTPPNQDATGLPIIYPSAEGAGILLADLSGIGDPNGLTYNENTQYNFSYQWIRVDSGTSAETNVGSDSARYQSVDADIGNLIKVSVSFTDGDGYSETVTSLTLGPLSQPAGPPAPPSEPTSTLVSNTGQSPSATAMITQQYAMGFRLGNHGQGYEISSVSIELAAVPSNLTVSLWISAPPTYAYSGVATFKLFDFENPSSFQVGLNKFTAPAGAFAYQNVNYFIVLSGFGSSLSIKETTSNGQDAGGETGAILFDDASVRALGSTGRWGTSSSRGSVLRLTLEGSRRISGILASNYAQASQSSSGDQEILSIGDEGGMPINLGAADRYLIRGFSWLSDDTTSRSGGITNPFDLRSGFTLSPPTGVGPQAITSTGAKLFSLINIRSVAGINVWTAPQGATVAGSGSYLVYEKYDTRPDGVVISRFLGTSSDDEDSPPAPGVTLSDTVGDLAGRPLMAFLGEPLYAMVQNLGQTDNGYVSVGGTSAKVLSQGFTTGSEAGGYGLLGIGVNIEGSESSGNAQLPDDATSVSVSVYTADADGEPDTKLFDLVSPAEYAAGHSFFEAPAGATLAASTSYVLVWSHNSGTLHRLQRTTSDDEDSDAFGGSSIADAFYRGADVDNLTVDTGGNALEIVVYTDTTPRNASGQPRVLSSAEGAPYLFADTSDLADAEGLPFTGLVGGHIEFTYSYQWIRVDPDTEAESNIGADSPSYRLVDADIGKLIKVQVSFTDRKGLPETVTSLPFGPVLEPDPLPSPSTLVGNTGQSASATAVITGQYYNMGFTLGSHGQGYELSSVSIELAAVPSSLNVSLWIGDHSTQSSSRRSKLFDFENPAPFVVGLNTFTAPAGVLLYQHVNYFIVLSGFDSSLSIKETTSDAEDEGGETGAILFDSAGGDSSVLRLAIEGSRRASGILGSTYAQPFAGDQEIISIGDDCCFEMGVGSADRYLIRGFSWRSDDTTSRAGGVTNPWHLLAGTSSTAAKLFKLINTRNAAGITEWTAPRGATVAGGVSNRYTFEVDWQSYKDSVGSDSRTGGELTRIFATTSAGPDRPSAPGVTFSSHEDIAVPANGAALLAVLGEPLYAMVQNLGQTDNSYVSVGGTNKVLSQAFTTGSEAGGYGLLGIGVNIEGSESNGNAQLPDNAMSVSVAVYTADADGEPDTKLFDLVSPTEYVAGHSFFEAPAGTTLDASTSYVLVWSHLSGAPHRLQRTLGDAEDSGALGGSSIADAFYRGADVDNLTVDTGGNALEIVVYTDTTPRNASGQPRVLSSAEGAPYLFADTSRIADENGIPFTPPDGEEAFVEFTYSYQWIRVDGMTETNIGVDSPRYYLVDADIGNLIKVEVSFTDQDSYPETVTSLPFSPVLEPDPLPSPSTLVSNTGQSASATAVIDKQYALEFTLGDHGQGYEISSVSIELAAVPSDLTVSLWIGNHSNHSSTPQIKLFDFANPSPFVVGLNKFAAPAGVLAYQRVRYYIVLSDFGSSLSIKETTSDAEDAGGESGAELRDSACVRALDKTGRWESDCDGASVLRLAVEGSRRASGILVSTFAQPFTGDQEIISIDDDCCFGMAVGAADRYLIRGFSWNSDDTTSKGGGITNPFDLREGTSSTGAKLFRLINTRNAAGITEWTAPQGATVAGGSSKTYNLGFDWDFPYHLHAGTRTGAALTRIRSTPVGNTGTDTPRVPGVSLSQHGDIAVIQPIAAVLGEPLYAMVQNLGEANNSYVSVGGASAKVLSQGFTTGSEAGGYGLLGIGVNIEGSDDSNSVAQLPDDATSVSVAVHADSSGKPGAKLFDLVSPAEYAAGHSFFEAPAGTTLDPSTSYVLVWKYNAGTLHRLQQTLSNGEDSGALGGSSIADAFYLGADLDNLSVNSGGNALEIVVYTDTTPRNASGRPVVLVSAEGGSILAADTSRIADEDGLPYTGRPDSGIDGYVFSYQWFRVDGVTETEVGADSQRYQLVDADIGKLIQVRVSFVDRNRFPEAVSSLPFGPVPWRAPSQAPTTLVGNTGQTPSATANVTGQYAMGFRLGVHGQGYEISSVSLDLAAVPSTLSVSLWNGGPRGSSSHGSRTAKLFDFENPPSFKVGLNKFTAPAGAFAYQNLNYWIVLSDFGDSLPIMETTSDAEDAGGETGAILFDSAGGDSSVLRLAVEGSKRDSGILASNYAQPIFDMTDPPTNNQEITSLGDTLAWGIVVGAADRYLVRGVSFAMDDTTSKGAGFINPFALRSNSLTGARQFDLANTRDANGTPVWTAPQGATVEGGCTTAIVMMVEEVTCKQYIFDWADINVLKAGGIDRIGATLTRLFGVTTDADGQSDTPTAPGVSLTIGGFVAASDYAGPTPLMAVHGEPLVAMVSNLGQTDHGYRTVGSITVKALTQGFTAGSNEFGYRLQGIGVNIEGSDSKVPDDASSVSVAVHADLNGKPGAKLFDLVSPTEFAAGHSFFEAPPGTTLAASTSYVLVWRYIGGTVHRLQKTSSDNEDSGALTDFSMANAFYQGVDLDNLAVDSNSDVLEIAVYGEASTKAPFVPGGIPVTKSWLHIPEGVDVGYQFRALFVTHRGRLPTSGDIEEYNTWVQWEAEQAYSDPIIRSVASEFKAVACTAEVDARTNTNMPADAFGVPIHWLDGGWDDRPTLVASYYPNFYSDEWENTEYGAYVTGNSAYFHPAAKVWTGCDASGDPHPSVPMGAISAMDMVAVGTPRDPAANNAPLGAVDVDIGFAYYKYSVVIDGEEQERLLPLYAISPIFTVVSAPEGE